MLVDTFANRLQKALDLNNWKPIDLTNKTGLDKSLISNYLSGNYKAGQDNLTTLAESLGVDETWLMGYDVPITSQKSKKNKEMEDNLDDFQLLYQKYKHLISKDDLDTMSFILKKYEKKEEIGDKK